MIGIFVLIALLAIYVSWRLYRRYNSDSNCASYLHAWSQHALTLTAWLFSAAIFIAVMYPIVRLMFWLSFLGSAALIWIGWEQKEDIRAAKMNGSSNGWKTFKKPMRTFGFIGLAVSSVTVVFLRCFIYLEQHKSGEYFMIALLMLLGAWSLYRRKKRKFNRLNEKGTESFRDYPDKMRTQAFDTVFLLVGWTTLIISVLMLIKHI